MVSSIYSDLISRKLFIFKYFSSMCEPRPWATNSPVAGHCPVYQSAMVMYISALASVRMAPPLEQLLLSQTEISGRAQIITFMFNHLLKK